MKILQVINSLQMGGAERLITELAPRLHKMGNDVDVLVLDGTETPFMKLLYSFGINVIKLNSNAKSPYSIINLFKLLPIVRRYDIVHSHTTPAQLHVAISRFFSRSFKAITTEHSTNNHRRGNCFYKYADKIMYSLYDCVVCISELSKTKLQEQIGNRSDIKVIENGIDVDSFRAASPLMRASINLSDSDYVLTMVGRFVDAKDQDTLIRAMALLPNHCKLVLVGLGPRRGYCEDLAKKLGVNERTVFLGERDDVPSILHASDIILMSSHWEGLSLSSLEGMSVGKPFLASDVDGLREVVDGAGLLFEEGNENNVADYVLKLMNDRDYSAIISGRCLERARKYDIMNAVKKYNDIYHQL